MDLRTRNVVGTGVGWLLSAVVVVAFLMMVASWSATGRPDTDPVSATGCAHGEVMAEDGSCVPKGFYSDTDYEPVEEAQGGAYQPCARGEIMAEDGSCVPRSFYREQHAAEVAADQAVQTATREAERAAAQMRRGCY